MSKSEKVKYLGIIILCSFLDMSLHILTSGISSIPEGGNFSFLVKILGLQGAAVLWIVAAFSAVAGLFLKYKDKLPGVGCTRGLRFGTAIAVLWLCGMFEGVPLLGHTLLFEGAMGLSDAIPVVIMGTLLGLVAKKDRQVEVNSNKTSASNKVIAVIIFSATYLVGRYLFYITKIMESGYQVRPYETFIWTLAMGACIGVAYTMIGQITKSASTLIGSIKFGGIIFGLSWFSFLIFVPILYAEMLGFTMIRVTADIFLVSLSYYLSESVAKKLYNKNKKGRLRNVSKSNF